MTQTRRFGKGWVVAGVLSALGLLSAGLGEARAAFTVTLVSTAPSGPNTQFNFSAAIAPEDTLTAGDFFRIYDFAGYVAGSITAPAGWTGSVANSSPTPPPNVILSHGDDPATPNLIFTYTGATPINGPAFLTGFAATSTFGFLGAIKDFVGLNTQATGPTAGADVSSIGDVRVPGVPEPASLVSIGLGALAMGAVYGLRRRGAVRV